MPKLYVLIMKRNETQSLLNRWLAYSSCQSHISATQHFTLKQHEMPFACKPKPQSSSISTTSSFPAVSAYVCFTTSQAFHRPPQQFPIIIAHSNGWRYDRHPSNASATAPTHSHALRQTPFTESQMKVKSNSLYAHHHHHAYASDPSYALCL